MLTNKSIFLTFKSVATKLDYTHQVAFSATLQGDTEPLTAPVLTAKAE